MMVTAQQAVAEAASDSSSLCATIPPWTCVKTAPKVINPGALAGV